jgi:hypothetical protein
LLPSLLGIEIHSLGAWYRENNKITKNGENNPFLNPCPSGKNNSPVYWHVPALGTNPKVSNKTKFQWDSSIRFQDILHQ